MAANTPTQGTPPPIDESSTQKPAAQHPRHQLDEVIHAPVRLSIMATLADLDKAEFSLVRDTVEISDSVLSRQAGALEEAGYLHIKKGYVGKRPRTWYSLTTRGRSAYESHLAALRQIVRQSVGES